MKKHSKNQSNLVAAVLSVMTAVSNIEKNLVVGSVGNQYKGVGDKDVKLAMSKAFIEAGLIILPINVRAKTKVERWEETYNQTVRTKQQVFIEVKTKYKLLHKTGEFQIIEGLGHGIDTQDKAAGKATTYALKYALLYSFLVATGNIEDTDNEHSDNKQIPGSKAEDRPTQPAAPDKSKQEVLNPENKKLWGKAVLMLQNKETTIDKIVASYNITPEFQAELLKAGSKPKKNLLPGRADWNSTVEYLSKPGNKMETIRYRYNLTAEHELDLLTDVKNYVPVVEPVKNKEEGETK